METFIIPPGTRDYSPEVLGDDGRMKILPASFWKPLTPLERAKFCMLNGFYSLPTVELVEHLRTLIGDRYAIEIGAGNGVLAETLGIKATDNRMQERSPWRETILATGQPCVQYGDNVFEAHASRAVRQFSPDVIVACWVHHKYRKERHERGGNMIGVDWPDVMQHCRELIFVGNEKIHQDSDIWNRKPFSLEYPDWLYSRAMNGSRDFIARFKGSRR